MYPGGYGGPDTGSGRSPSPNFRDSLPPLSESRVQRAPMQHGQPMTPQPHWQSMTPQQHQGAMSPQQQWQSMPSPPRALSPPPIAQPVSQFSRMLPDFGENAMQHPRQSFGDPGQDKPPHDVFADTPPAVAAYFAQQLGTKPAAATSSAAPAPATALPGGPVVMATPLPGQNAVPVAMAREVGATPGFKAQVTPSYIAPTTTAATEQARGIHPLIAPSVIDVSFAAADTLPPAPVYASLAPLTTGSREHVVIEEVSDLPQSKLSVESDRAAPLTAEELQEKLEAERTLWMECMKDVHARQIKVIEDFIDERINRSQMLILNLANSSEDRFIELEEKFGRLEEATSKSQSAADAIQDGFASQQASGKVETTGTELHARLDKVEAVLAQLPKENLGGRLSRDEGGARVEDFAELRRLLAAEQSERVRLEQSVLDLQRSMYAAVSASGSWGRERLPDEGQSFTELEQVSRAGGGQISMREALEAERAARIEADEDLRSSVEKMLGMQVLLAQRLQGAETADSHHEIEASIPRKNERLDDTYVLDESQKRDLSAYHMNVPDQLKAAEGRTTTLS